jgi:hypothetical protein
MRLILSGPIPWLLPGLLLAFNIWLLAPRWVAGRLRIHPVLGLLMIMGLGLVISATLTPLRHAIENGTAGTGTCDLSQLWPTSPRSWLSLSDRTMNIIMFVPLALAIGLVPLSPSKVALVIEAIALPFVIESVQLLAPILGRGCEGADLVDNLTGLLLGLVAGTVVGRFVAAGPAPSSTRGNADPGVR